MSVRYGTSIIADRGGFDWVGTLAQYEEAYSKGQIANDWVCYITDDVIDTSSNANIDLSNLSEAGEIHIKEVSQVDTKVSKSGDTMTGNLNITKNTPFIYLTDNLADYTDTSSTASTSSTIYFRDKNNKNLGFIRAQHDTYNRQYTEIYAIRSINGAEKKNAFTIGVDSAGKPWFNRPQLITTYTSGTSGYNIWSNGYCEQWGYGDTTNKSITFAKKFKDTNYNLIGVEFYIAAAGRQTVTKRVDGFTTGSDQASAGTNGWRACGYLASDQY